LYYKRSWLIRKIVKDALMKLEDAPSRIAPASSEIITIGRKIGKKLELNGEFQRRIISIKELTTPLATNSEQD